MAESGMAGIPGIGAMTDTLEFVKNLWGGMKIPGMAMPSLSVDDINKQITDLKAVEAWLNVNMNMLRSTIQALEVQSATLAALQSMSASMASMVQPGTAAKPNGQPQQAATSSNPASQPPSFNFAAPTADKPAPPGAQSGAQPAAAPAAPPPAGAIGMEGAATFANPAAWWNLLQDQFRQAVSTAVAPESHSEKPGESDASGNDAPDAVKPKSRSKPKAESASGPRKRTPKA